MDTVLAFFSDMILFTAGLAVAIFWLIIFILMADEIIDLFLAHRNKDQNEEEV